MALMIVGVLYVAIALAIGGDMFHTFTPSQMRHTILKLDYSRFWYVGQRLLKQAGGPALSQDALRQIFPNDILSTAKTPLRAWLYPPTMNLLAMAFALLPLQTSFWAWALFSNLVSGWLLRIAGLPWSAIVLGLLCTANLNNLFGGQSGALLGSILVASLLLMDKRPYIAGILAGCLTLKPQLGFAFVAILSQRWRRILPWTILVATGLIGLSIVLQGVGRWIWFFKNAGPIGTRIISGPFRDASPSTSFSVFMMARSFNVSVVSSYVLQFITAGISLAFIAAAWRRPTRSAVRMMAFTVCLATLITPYGFIYDLTGFGIAMAAMFVTANDQQKIVFSILWLMSGYSVPVMLVTDRIIFPLCAILGAIMCQPFTSRLNPPAPPPPLYAAGR
jgi:hypothetical protein